MKIYRDTSLRYFEFWGAAYDNVTELSHDDLDSIETILEDLYPDGMDATDLNDLFCYDFDTVLEWVGKERFGDSDSIVDSDDIEELYPSELIQNYGNDFREAVWDAYTAYMEGTDEEDWAYTNVDDLFLHGILIGYLKKL